MGSLSFSEIVVIVLVILVVFGPQRLPDLARKAGELMGKVRNASSTLTDALGTDFEATIEPIKSVKRDFDGIKSDLTRTVTSFGAQEPAGRAPSSVDPAASPVAEDTATTDDATSDDAMSDDASADGSTDPS